MKQSLPIFLLVLVLSLSGGCTDHDAMQERLAYVSACNRADTVFSARWVPTVDSLVDYFDRHGSPNDRMMAHYLQGRVHHDMGEAPQAVDCYQEAVSCADTLAQDCDYHTLAAVYGQMSILFHEQFLPDDEIVALNSLAKSARLDHDTLTEIVAIDRLTNSYFMKGDTDSVLIVEKQARELYLKYGYKEYAGQAVLGSIWIELNRHNLSETERLLNIYRNESGLFDVNGELIRPSAYYVDKGVYMTQVGNLDSAQYYFRKAISYGIYEGGYRGLMSVFQKRNQADSIAKYARLFAAANDSSFLHVNQEAVHRISALYNYTRQQKIAEEQAEKARTESRKKRILMGIILMLIVGTFFTLRYFKKRSRERFLKLSLAYDKSKAELAAALDRQQLLHYEYEEAMKGKDDERQLLISQIQEDMLQKEDEIELLKKRTKMQEEQLRQLSSVDMESVFKKSDIYKLFNERKNAKYVQSPPSEEDWHELIELFRTHYVRFNTFITCDHRLSANQYRYCILLRLGFDNTDIGILMGKDKDQRHHLRKFICEALFGKTANVKQLEELLKEHY